MGDLLGEVSGRISVFVRDANFVLDFQTLVGWKWGAPCQAMFAGLSQALSPSSSMKRQTTRLSLKPSEAQAVQMDQSASATRSTDAYEAATQSHWRLRNGEVELLTIERVISIALISALFVRDLKSTEKDQWLHFSVSPLGTSSTAFIL